MSRYWSIGHDVTAASVAVVVAVVRRGKVTMTFACVPEYSYIPGCQPIGSEFGLTVGTHDRIGSSSSDTPRRPRRSEGEMLFGCLLLVVDMDHYLVQDMLVRNTYSCPHKQPTMALLCKDLLRCCTPFFRRHPGYVNGATFTQELVVHCCSTVLTRRV